MELEKRMNLEARLAELEHFKDFMLEEVLPKIEMNNVAMQEITETLASGHVTLMALVQNLTIQNLAIQQIGKDEWEALLNDEAFQKETVELLEASHADLSRIIAAARMKIKLMQLLGGLAGHEPSEELCSKCDEPDCDQRKADFKGED